jgi:branched-chain amino acid aminotransferase
MNQGVSKVWLDGKLIDEADAKVSLLTHTLHYGYGAFEGIRAYRRADGRSAVFRLDAHLDRLFDSCKILNIAIPFSTDQLRAACVDSLVANRLAEGYVRPLVFVGEGAMGLHAVNNPIRVAIMAWKWGAYLGDKGLNEGIRAKVSSFLRHDVGSAMCKGKIVGQYVNSILAKREALAAGYDEAILLDGDGYACEGSGENLFIVRSGTLKTPATGSSILGGITRDSVIKLAREAGYSVKTERFTRDEMWIADEVFLTGTAAEVTPVREIDDRPIGSGEPGPVTRAVQERFFETVRGRTLPHPEWLTFYEPEV